jgi:CheY-like chemotaxis protein
MALTAVGRRGDAALVQEIGFSAYLLKPFEPAHLHDALVEVVHRGVPSGSAPAPGAQIVTRHSVAEARRQRLRILVVEDNPVNQLVAVAALRRAGYKPQTAASASEAIQAQAMNHFDLIFMDLELPDLDGIEATAELRRMEEGTGIHTPVVALTGHDQPEIHKRCRSVGMKDVMVKPLDLDVLCSGIDRWTQPDTVRVEPAATASAAPAPPAPSPAAAEPAMSDGGLRFENSAGEAIGSQPEAAAEVALSSFEGAPPGAEMGGLPVVELAATPPPAPAATPPAVIELPQPSMPGQQTSMPAPEAGETVLDEARLESSCMGNPELKNILVRTFIHHIRPRLRRLREVTAAGDAKAVEFEAHGLKGMSATIGAVSCADAFGRIERMGRENRLEPVGPMLDYAEIEVGRVEAVIGPRRLAA